MNENNTTSYPFRRALAGIGIVVFLLIYIFLVIEIGKYIPEKPIITLIYYAVTGVAWGFPLLPLLTWAEGRKKHKK